MSDRILVPVLGESVTEATVAKWLKNEGDKVNVDEPIVELETDKVNVEVPAPSNGILENISVKEGQTVNVGALLGTMNVLNNSAVNLPVEEKEYAPPPKKPEEIKEIKNIEKEKVTNEEEPLVLTEVHNEKEQSKTSTINLVSPAARKIATESKINLAEIKGSGKNGIILKEDLLSLMG